MTNRAPNWPVKKLGEIAPSIQYGYTESSTLEEVGPKFLRITDIQNGKVDWNSVPYCKCDDLEKYRLQPGDILFARTGATTGKSFLIRDCPDSVFASYLIRVQLSKEVSPGYIYQFFQTPSYWSHITQFTTGSTQGGFNASKLAEIGIPLPLLPIQKQIAAILEKADAAREKRWQANQLTKQFLQSAFLEMFGDPVTNPKNWQVMNLGEIARKEKFSIVDGPFGSHLKASEYTQSGVRVIRVNNIYPNEFNFGDIRYVSAEKYESIKRSTVRPKDVLMAKVGNTIGKTCVFPDDIQYAVLTANVCKITLDNEKAHPTFISRQMNFDSIQLQIRKLSGDTAKPMINLPRLRQLKLIVPPVSEQRQLADLVEKVESLRAKQRESEKELENLFGSLMQRAFNGDLEFATDPK